MIRTLPLLAALAAASAAPGAASAHIVLSPDHAVAGGYYAGVFRVSHGCDGSPTVALRVEIPTGVVTAKPQPKPGWTLEIEREPLASPVKGEGGRAITQRVKAITWRGRLPDDDFDTFGVTAKLPPGSALLYFPAVQTCETGAMRWTDIPAPGQAWHAVPHPAPVLTPDAAGDAMAGMR